MPAAAVILAFGGSPASADVSDAVQLIEVEENADRPDTLRLRLPVNRTDAGELQFVDDGTLDPSTNVTVVVTPNEQSDQCIFDGYLTSWNLRLDPTMQASTIDAWGQDASWLMSLDDKIRQWPDITNGSVANQIFSEYGFSPTPENTSNDSPVHATAEHTLFQRSTDLEFLRGLARRNGKLCRVACTSTPGLRYGYFVTPAVDRDPVAVITLGDPPAVDELRFDWDVMRPTEVDASQVPLTDASVALVEGDSESSGLAPLGDRNYKAYAGGNSTLRLSATADASELTMRTSATLQEAGWFMRCRGETDINRLGTTIRAGTIVSIAGAGRLHSGKWLVWNVRHRITGDVYRLQFTLVRNAIGAAAV